MWLAEQGLVSLDDPVAAHLPAKLDFDTNGATIRQLLSMTSGLQDAALIDDPALIADPQREWTPEEILASVPGGRTPPGATYLYSNTNYILLGLVIEQVTGMSVARALRAHILADLGLSTLVYQTEERPKGPIALPFIGSTVRRNILEHGGGYLATKADASALGAAGGMASDAGALARFAYFLWGGQLLSEASLQTMTDFGSGAGYHEYGLGTIDMTTRGKGFAVPAIGHGGQDGAGYASTMIALPSAATVVTVLINQDVDPRVRAIPVAQALLDALDATSTPSAPTPSATSDSSVTPLDAGPHAALVMGTGTYPGYTVDLPDGWYDRGGRFTVKYQGPGPVLGLSVWDVGQVFRDPCHWQGQAFDPGPSVDDLVAALVAQRMRNATKPVEVTLAGYAGRYLELSVPADMRSSAWTSFDDCDVQPDGARDFQGWLGNGMGNRYEQVPGQVDRLWALDVDGQRLLVDATYSPDTAQADRDELQRIAESLRFVIP